MGVVGVGVLSGSEILGAGLGQGAATGVGFALLAAAQREGVQVHEQSWRELGQKGGRP